MLVGRKKKGVQRKVCNHLLSGNAAAGSQASRLNEDLCCAHSSLLPHGVRF